MLTGMATGNRRESMEMVKEMQQKMMDPSAKISKTKKSTGRRLTPKEIKKAKKEREKLLRQKRRDKKQKKHNND